MNWQERLINKTVTKKMEKSKTYKNHLWTLLFLVLIIPWKNTVYSQGLFNDGAAMTVESGALLHVDGDGNGNYTHSSTGTIDIDGDMEVEGNWTNNGSNNVFTGIGTDGTVKLVGTTQQEVGGSGWTDFENLTVNNPSGAKMTVNSNRVNGTLTLTNGTLTLNSNTLIINNTATSAITRTSGYILSETNDGSPNPCNSRVQWNIGEASSSSAFTIPFVTSGAIYIPITTTITTAGTGASGNITAATYPTADDNTPYPSYPETVTSVAPDPLYAIDRYELIAFESYTANPTVDIEMTYDPADIVGNTIPEANIQAQAWSGSQWQAPTGTVDEATNKVSFTGISMSRAWVLTNNNNPLPIELVEFKAKCNNDKVELTWATQTETNNNYFTIFKSHALQDWDIMADFLPGAGNSESRIDYSYTDYSPYDITYYRLKQTDFNGDYSYSDIISATCAENGDVTDFEISSISFNENRELNINLNSVKGGVYHFILYDDVGKQLIRENYNSIAGDNLMSYNLSHLSDGIYMFTVYNNDKKVTKKILLQN